MITGVYAIDGPVGMRYVGQAVNVAPRWRQHMDNLQKNKTAKTNPTLQRDWNSFGISAFTFHVLEMCDQFELSSRELFWISSWDRDKLYNGVDETVEHRNQGRIKLSNGLIFKSQMHFSRACGYASEHAVAVAMSRGDNYEAIAKRRGLL